MEMAEQEITAWAANKALAARLGALKKETAEWIDELQGEDARQAARLDALEQAAKDQARNSNASAIAFNARLKALERWLSLGVRPGEWVQGNELLAADAYDVGCTCGVGGGPSEHHAQDCPMFIPF